MLSFILRFIPYPLVKHYARWYRIEGEQAIDDYVEVMQFVDFYRHLITEYFIKR